MIIQIIKEMTENILKYYKNTPLRKSDRKVYANVYIRYVLMYQWFFC